MVSMEYIYCQSEATCILCPIAQMFVIVGFILPGH